ncbi:MAG TPA: SRPBCC domain-containing protein, partial [Gaiellaceae bacterium]|nr:SRPBCC domain-containing protein [Gaiellaceae bacterium]
ERLVLTFADVQDAQNTNVEVLTVTFTDVGGKTEVVAHQAGNMPQEQYPRLADGYRKFFDALAEHLAQSQS